MGKHILYIITIALLVNLGNAQGEKTKSYIHIQMENSEPEQWKLIWQDEFNGTELDTTKWTRIPPNNADWGNYMTSDERCYEITDGKLFLKGIVNRDTLADPRPFLTGGIYTKGKFAFQYGKVEIRVKLESAQGAWPAIWMLAEGKKYGKYPRNGEIDIMEHLNYDSIVYQTTHSYYTLELKQKTNPRSSSTTAFDPQEYTIFGLEWYPDKLVYTVNGKATLTYPRIEGVDASQWPFDQPFYVLIDQQLGGSWVGEIDSVDLPVQMIVDWIKVYQ